MNTPLQKLASEADQLWKDITRAQEILAGLDRPSGRPSARTEARDKDLAKIRDFEEEAGHRVHVMEEYIMLLRPEDKTDALIQMAAAHQILRDNAAPADGENDLSPRQRLALRMLGEATAFLGQESGASIPENLSRRFGWMSDTTWEQVHSESCVLLDRYYGQIDKAA